MFAPCTVYLGWRGLEWKPTPGVNSVSIPRGFLQHQESDSFVLWGVSVSSSWPGITFKNPLESCVFRGPKATFPSLVICLLLLFMTLCPILLISYNRKSQRTEFFGFSCINTDCEHKEAILSFAKNFRMNKTVLSHTNSWHKRVGGKGWHINIYCAKEN